MNISDAPDATWSWDFGDSTSSRRHSPKHVYTEAGTYVVSLAATNDGGTDTFHNNVVVEPPPQAPEADFTYDDSNDPEFSFTDTSDGEVTGWFWDFGDGFDSNAQNPDHTYVTNGTYTVTLIVSGPGGDDSISTEVEVNGGLVP